MKKVLILGANGMLGSSMHQVLSKKDLELFSTTRSGEVLKESKNFKFDAVQDDIDVILSEIGGVDFVVNCIGLISHKMTGKSTSDEANAFILNSIFPFKLALAGLASKSKVIQISTDCVFSGNLGPYSENSKHDAHDIYGLSKSLGEVLAPNVMNLRCSIIGNEQGTSFSLMDWFLNQDSKSSVKGYINHKWNGLTTLSFSNIVSGIILQDKFYGGLHHLIPSNVVTKFELLALINKYGRSKPIRLVEFDSEKSIDRELTTNAPDRNVSLWNSGGYSRIPSIEDMLVEYFRHKGGENFE